MNGVNNGSGNALLPDQGEAIIWTNADLLSIGPLGTNFNEIQIAIWNFSFMKMHLKMCSVKWWPFCPDGDESTVTSAGPVNIQDTNNHPCGSRCHTMALCSPYTPVTTKTCFLQATMFLQATIWFERIFMLFSQRPYMISQCFREQVSEWVIKLNNFSEVNCDKGT